MILFILTLVYTSSSVIIVTTNITLVIIVMKLYLLLFPIVRILIILRVWGSVCVIGTGNSERQLRDPESSVSLPHQTARVSVTEVL